MDVNAVITVSDPVLFIAFRQSYSLQQDELCQCIFSL